MGLLYNVTAFLRGGQPIDVKVKPATGAEPWPVRIKIGPGGEDTIDVFAGVLDATRLRDALTEALERVGDSESETALCPGHDTAHGRRVCDLDH